MLMWKEPRCIPKARIANPLRCDHDDEYGRPVHDHHVAAVKHAHAERLGGCVDGANNNGSARGKAGFRSRLGCDRTGNVCRPRQVWHEPSLNDVFGKRIAPAPFVHHIEGSGTRCRVVVDDKSAS